MILSSLSRPCPHTSSILTRTNTGKSLLFSTQPSFLMTAPGNNSCASSFSKSSSKSTSKSHDLVENLLTIVSSLVNQAIVPPINVAPNTKADAPNVTFLFNFILLSPIQIYIFFIFGQI